MTDVLGRSWQMGTIQLDAQMPRRFGLAYTSAENAEEVPYVIHRALLGSMERFIGILIEHYGGDFPLWLAPEQLRVVPVRDSFADEAAAVANELRARGVRVGVDGRPETLGKRMREAELAKIPCVVVWGERESREGMAVRRRHGEQSTESLEGLADELSRAA